MASAPTVSLPLLYKDLTPLNLRDHAKWRLKLMDTADFLVGQHAFPLTVDEFMQAHRHFPIVFSAGEKPVPLALMGLNEGINTFVDDKGKLTDDVYMPAYVRRYPFILAKLEANTENMSLCFDPTAPVIGEFKTGEALFEEGQPSQYVKNVMEFCEKFEHAGMRTQQFIEELQKHDLLMEGEVAIQRTEDALKPQEEQRPFLYRGFKIVNGEKFAEIRGDKLREWNQNGILTLIYCHLFSLDMMRIIFARQTAQGKGPGAEAEKPKKSKK